MPEYWLVRYGGERIIEDSCLVPASRATTARAWPAIVTFRVTVSLAGAAGGSSADGERGDDDGRATHELQAEISGAARPHLVDERRRAPRDGVAHGSSPRCRCGERTRRHIWSH